MRNMIIGAQRESPRENPSFPTRPIDALSRHLDELSRPGAYERRRDGNDHRRLLEFVESESRGLSAEAFASFMSDAVGGLYGRISTMLSRGNDIHRRIGGILAIDELIDVKTMGEDAAKIKGLASLLSKVLEEVEEPALMELATKSLGRLVKSGAAMTSEIVEREVRRSIFWLDPKSEGTNDNRKLAAVMLLREMAEQSPAVFNTHVKAFLDSVWHPLRDARAQLREAAVKALKQCLMLVEMRETRYRVQYYYKMFEVTTRGLNRDLKTGAMPSAESVHGSLLALGELLEHTGEFLLARYKEVVETVLKFKDSRERQIKRVVLMLLPKLASFSPERFTGEYLIKSLAHLIGVLKIPQERGVAFAALAETAWALKGMPECITSFECHLGAIAFQIKESIALSKQKPRVNCPEALSCIGVLSKSLVRAWEPHIISLLDVMMTTGLSEILVVSLKQVSEALPGNRELQMNVRLHLLDLLSLVVAKRPFNATTNQARFQALSAALATGDLQGSGLIRLALETFATFDWGELNLLDFMKDHLAAFLDDGCKETRKSAVLACCNILEKNCSPRPSISFAPAPAPGGGREGQSTPPPPSAMSGSVHGMRQSKVIEQVSLRLLMSAVADPSERVRASVVNALQPTTALDEYLAQAECLRPLFIALNDQSRSVRALAVKLIGKLADHNPAYVNPGLRRHLLQLLNDLENSPDSKHKEDSAFLLECLISSLPSLVLPYVSPIQKALMTRLKASMLQASAAGASGGSGGANGGAGGGGGGGAVALASSVAGRALLSAASGTVGVRQDGSFSSNAVTRDDRVNLASNSIAAAPVGVAGPVGGSGASLVSKEAALASENSVAAAVLSAIGQLSLVAKSDFRPYVNEALPLVIEAIQDLSSPNKRLVAVMTLGQIVENTGTVMTPYMDYPQLLAVLLKMLHEGSQVEKREVMRLFGAIGALDPHTHKTNQASLKGEGKLALEGVRPLRQQVVAIAGGTGGGGGGGGGGVIGQGQAQGAAINPADQGAATIATAVATAVGEFGAIDDLLPSSNLVSSSEEYYPTVAINALARVLRDASLVNQHLSAIVALMNIFKALGMGSVPYLPKVLPVLLSLLHGADRAMREEILSQFTHLVTYVRLHIRRFLSEMLSLVHTYWTTSSIKCLRLLAEISASLKEDFKVYVPELLPRFSQIFSDAERLGNYDLIKPALSCLEALSPSIEGHLHLLLPSLLRLLGQGRSSAPTEAKKATLRSIRKLLPRMSLANGYSSAILHPLIKILDGPTDDLRKDALDAMCSIAVVLGQDFAIFVPTIRKVVQRYKMQHEWFERVANGTCPGPDTPPPCMSDADDWETLSAWWALELDQKQQEQAAALLQQGPLEAGGGGKLSVNPVNLRRAWESSQRVTKEDWVEWMRNFSVELLRQSPSPALRACCDLAQLHPTMARELFAAGFVSCWAELDGHLQEQLVRSLEAALASPTITPETVTALLNLAEFMEHDDKRLPLDSRTLGALAQKCHAYAKALHYKELEFQTSPLTAVEALIHINNQLRQPEAAVGILTYAQKHLNMELKEGWYEKLCRWEEALNAYKRRLEVDANVAQGLTSGPRLSPHERHNALLGEMRCLAALGEWDSLSNLCHVEWKKSEMHMRREMGMLAATAAWHMGKWGEMATYVDTVDPPQWVESVFIPNHMGQTSNGAFLRAVLSVRQGDAPDVARIHIDRARDLMANDFAALVGESYERAYSDMVRVQQLAELDEVVLYQKALAKKDPNSEARIHFIKQLWRDRLKGVQRNIDVWQPLFAVRQLVVPMSEDVDNWLKFASICRKGGRDKQSERMLVKLLGYDPKNKAPGQKGYGSGSGSPNVMLAFLKHLWQVGDRQEAYSRLKEMVDGELVLPFSSTTSQAPQHNEGGKSLSLSSVCFDRPRASLHARAFLRLGLWQWTMNDQSLDSPVLVEEIKSSLSAATKHATTWSKAWHQWALFNVAVMQKLATSDSEAALSHVAPAVRGFFRSIALGQAAGDRTGNLQDILRLLTLWFNHGSSKEVEVALVEGFQLVSIDTWLVVVPQVIARIHTNNSTVRELIHKLLIKVGGHHPQALMYPLLVATKSQSKQRRDAADRVLREIGATGCITLVEQAALVSKELIRMAILWHELWHEGLEEASRLYFGESNVEGMLTTLLPLHEMMEKQGPTTLKEIQFMQAYGRELSEAYGWLEKYKTSRKEAELHQAWDLYYHVFKRINKQLHTLTTLDLQYVAPALVRAQGMELAVPGTYAAGEPLVTITAFAAQLQVISSKQRPRKLTIYGSNGAEYMFLLKGHEDLRQDERVMQLFGLVNTMLSNDRNTAERDLSIARYAVIPLSPNSGLIGWVPNCDTLHSLIREYRDTRKVPINWEHRLMLGLAPDYDNLMVIQKVEIFEHALDSTSGEDLHKILWLKSRSSEIWLDRRTAYTRSTAVMSMVGYILGLGDRHPSNLMLDRYSGKLLHIDFGDCFEASMTREKFPEKIPFRLTRMMVKAMEVSGIEGSFRTTCENVMRVLRANKESVTAMLEAFVHDPLINWRLLNPAEAGAAAGAVAAGGGAGEGGGTGGAGSLVVMADSLGPGGAGGAPLRRETREKELRELRDAMNQVPGGDTSEVLNSRAVEVMKRMSDKLTGRDYLSEGVGIAGGGMSMSMMGGLAPSASGEGDGVPAQVHRLLNQALNHENLCQSYVGWCPFW